MALYVLDGAPCYHGVCAHAHSHCRCSHPVSYRCHLARPTRGIDTASREFKRSRRKLIAEVSVWVGTLNSIASTAPYLGLAGTCLGILDNLSIGYVGSRQRFFLVMASRMAAAFLSTAEGLLVAIPAAVAHNYLRSRIEVLGSEVSKDLVQRRGLTFSRRPGIPLSARFPKLPFALIAVPALTVCVAAFMTFPSFDIPTGLHVGLAPDRCVYEGHDRLIVLRLTDAGELFINQTQEDWNSLPEVLAEIYGQRVHRLLYLRADDGVPFQTFADAIDIVENANVEPHQVARMGADKLDITVRLITPKAMNTSCLLEPVAIGSSQHASR